jgi:hypothetical protein
MSDGAFLGNIESLDRKKKARFFKIFAFDGSGINSIPTPVRAELLCYVR